MKRLAALTGTMVLVFFGMPALIADAHHESIGICHYKQKNRYEYIVVDKDGLHGHGKHKNDIIGVSGPEACYGGEDPDPTPTVDPTPTETTNPEPTETVDPTETTTPEPTETVTPTEEPSETPSETVTPTVTPTEDPRIVVVPVQPARVPNTCTDDEHLILPQTEGVDYVYLDNNAVQATPQVGYRFNGEQTVVFEYILRKAGEGLDCTEPTETASPTPSETTKSPTPHPSESNWTPGPVKTPPADVYECNDFATQADAQKVYDLYHTEFGDFANLDADNDGIACESDELLTPEPQITNVNSRTSERLPVTGVSVTSIFVVSGILLSVGALAVLSALFLRRESNS